MTHHPHYPTPRAWLPALARLGAACLFSLVLAGCASLEPEAAYRDVRADVAARSGASSPPDLAARHVEPLPAGPLDADQAVRMALHNSPVVQAALATLGRDEAMALQSRLLKNPFLHISALYPHNDERAALDVGVSWDVLGLLTLPQRQAAATAASEAARRKASASILQLAAQARAAWYAVLAAREISAWQAQQEEALSLAAQISQRLVSAGNAAPTSAHARLIAAQHARLARAQAETAAVQAEQRLLALLGAPTNAPVQLPARLPRLPEGDPEARTDMVAHNLRIAQLRAEQVQAQQRAGVTTRSGWLDDLELGWGWSRESDGVRKDGPSLGLALPLFDTGAARQHAAGFEAQRLDALLRQEERALAQQAQHLGMRMQQARQQVEHLREALLPRLAEAQDAALLDYNAMQKSVTHLLDLKQQEFATLQQLVQSLNDYWQARTGLEAINMGITLDADTTTITAMPPTQAVLAGGH